jgi:ribosome-associated protein
MGENVAMAGDLRVGSVVVPEGELSWRFSRSSGPGGQGVNTTDSRVELTYDLAGSPSLDPALRDRAVARLGGRLATGTLTVVASEHRSQLQNRRAAEGRLVELLTDAFAADRPTRRRTRPSRTSVRRRVEAKKRRGQTKRWRSSTDD